MVVHEREEHVSEAGVTGEGEERCWRMQNTVYGGREEWSRRRAVKVLLALAGDGGGVQPSWR